MKIFSAEQIKRIDQLTITRQGLSSWELMERASTALADKLLEVVPQAEWYGFLIGPGSNGGDGAAMARLLHERGKKVWLFQPFPDRTSPDLAANISRYKVLNLPLFHRLEEIQPGADTVLVDGFFGSGLSRALDGMWLDVFTQIKALHLPVVAIDLPSGLPADAQFSLSNEGILPAAHTLCIDSFKLAMLLPDSGPYCGAIHLVDIGLDQAAKDEQPSPYHLITGAEAASLLPQRPIHSHKGTFGTASLVGGTTAMPGALALATGAALRSGCGLVAASGPDGAREVVLSNYPEATWLSGAGQDEVETALWAPRTTALGIGPGMGTGGGATQVLKQVLIQAQFPVVIDADALNILAENKTWLSFLPKNSVLTPHPGELERLVGTFSTGLDRLQAAQQLAKKSGAVVVLKGHHTATCSPSGTVVFNSSGNSALAKGGSGDVLTGLITGLLAQGLAPLSASVLGVYVHGRAAELAVEKASLRSLLGRELIATLPEAFRSLDLLGTGV